MRTRLPLVLGLAGLLLIAAVVAQGRSAIPTGESRPLLGEISLPRIQLPAPPSGVSAPDREPEEPPSGAAEVGALLVVVVPLTLLGLAILIGLIQVVRRLRGDLGPTVPPAAEEDGEQDQPATQAMLLAAARQAREELRQHTGGPLANAVIAAWMRLEAAAAGAGTGRLPHQTPTEFTHAVLARHTMRTPDLDQLRVLYQRARFDATHQTSHADAAAARTALDHIVHALASRDEAMR